MEKVIKVYFDKHLKILNLNASCQSSLLHQINHLDKNPHERLPEKDPSQLAALQCHLYALPRRRQRQWGRVGL